MKKFYYLFAATLLAPTLIYAQPANDNCSGALPLVVNGDAVIADNTDATIYGPDGDCFLDNGEQFDGDVWFSIVITTPMTLQISTESGTSEDSQLVLYTIEDCGGADETFTQVACNDDMDLVTYMSQIVTNELDPGTYFLRASTYGVESAGSYSITVTSATLPENDTCAGAIELVVDGPALTADNTISTINGPSGTCYGYDQEVGETWFTFTTDVTMSLRILTEEGTSTDSQVSVFTIEGCGTGDEVYTEIACNDDASDENYMSIVDMMDLPAGTYYVKAGTYSTFFTGSYSISLQTLSGSGVEDVETPSFSIYPNPNTGKFTISNPGISGIYNIELIDVAGRVIYTQQSQMNSNGTTEVNQKNLTPGVYLVKMVNQKSNSFSTNRIVVQK